MTDPDKVVVLAVGIEQYEYGKEMRLPGAADHAARFARWAAECGVPSERITLATSRLGRPKLPAGNLVETPADLANIQNVLTEICKVPGELLLLYWCGHGVLNENRERALFTADARHRVKRNLVVDEILDYLGSSEISGYQRQIALIDSCANFIADMNLPEQIPRGGLPGGRPREIEQFALFAAAQGQIANFDPIRGEAAFSSVLLQWLEQNARVLDFDTNEMLSHVDRAFAELRDSGTTRQRPVYRRVRLSSGSDYDMAVGGLPISGHAQAAASASGMAVGQVRRITKSLADFTTRADPIVRKILLAKMLPKGTLLSSHASNFDESLLQTVAEGGAETVINDLRPIAVSQADRLSLTAVEECWRREEWITVPLRALRSATAEQVRSAYFRAVPAGQSGRPQDLDQALSLAAGYGPRPDQDAPLHIFVTLLEHSTGRRVPDTWFGIPAWRLASLRRTSAGAQAKTRRLVIDLRGSGGISEGMMWPAVVRAHLFQSDRGWSDPVDFTCRSDPHGVQQAVGEVLDWAYQQGIASFTIGFLLSRAAVDIVPEEWLYGNELEDPSPLWLQHPIILHSAERIGVPKARARWEERASTIRRWLIEKPARTTWLESSVRSDLSAIRREVSQSDVTCVGLGFTPGQLSGPLPKDPLIAMIAAGAPYLVWPSQDPADWEVFKEFVDDLVTAGTFDSTPDRLHQLRIKQPDAENLVRVFWDEPAALPPLGRLGGLSEGAV